METTAVVLEKPGEIRIATLALDAPAPTDIVVDIAWSGISTGTERLLWKGEMPSFPGMGYPLVPGYESVGTVVQAGPSSGRTVGETVFVPGARCYGDVRGLFGGAARRVVTQGDRVVPIDAKLGQNGVLIALAATAYHALLDHQGNFAPPDLIVGYGVLGRLLARAACAMGAPAPAIWENNPDRAEAGSPFPMVHPDKDERRDYRRIIDVSGDSKALDKMISHMAPGGEIVLAGFYSAPLSFAFPPAFMREARLRIAAEWKPADLKNVTALISGGQLSLDGLITHRRAAEDATDAYGTAFNDPFCLKMILDWSGCA